MAHAAQQRRQGMPEVALGLGGSGHEEKMRLSLEKVNFPSETPHIRAPQVRLKRIQSRP